MCTWPLLRTQFNVNAVDNCGGNLNIYILVNQVIFASYTIASGSGVALNAPGPGAVRIIAVVRYYYLSIGMIWDLVACCSSAIGPCHLGAQTWRHSTRLSEARRLA